MPHIDDQLIAFKKLIEDAIKKDGSKGKAAIIRSSKPINLIHDAVKYELIENGIDPELIYPHIGESSPEIRMAGHIKQKDQDVCVVPRNIKKEKADINWGPMSYLKDKDVYGFDFSNNTLVINVRSQISSLAKNFDTLFERTIAEAQNLHIRYPDIVLGEVYLIPVYEYKDAEVKNKNVVFKKKPVKIQKYISFFNAINNRKLSKLDGLEAELENTRTAYCYERCALLIVDFSQPKPKLYKNSQELIDDGLLPEDFSIEYSELSFDSFAKDIIAVYKDRFDIDNISLSDE